jgi:hypothetical protein
MNKKPNWEVGDLVKIPPKHELGIVLKVHTKAGDGFHYLISEGDTNKASWWLEKNLYNLDNNDECDLLDSKAEKVHQNRRNNRRF